jgi:hypothetical protein
MLMSLTDPLPVRPFWLERQIDPGSPDFLPGSAEPPDNRTHRTVTAVGTLDGVERAAVDPCGLVTPDHARWSLDWWVGAEDNWHVPSRSRTVRQRLLGTAPVVETALRAPGGDVLHRAYGFLSAELGPCVAVEIENRTAVPVAVALAVRPYHPLGLTRIGPVTLDRTDTGAGVLVDGQPAVLVARAPAELEDPAVSALAGRPCPGDPGSGAFVWPLTHTAILRAVIPLAPLPAGARRSRRATPAYPAAVPSAEQVAKGWEVQTRRGLHVEVPDDRWQSVVEASVAQLLLAHAGEDVATWPAGQAGPGGRGSGGVDLADLAAVTDALGEWGFAEEAAQLLGTWPERQALDGAFAGRHEAGEGSGRRHDAAGAALGAVARHWELTADGELVDGLVGPLAKGVHWIGKRRTARRATRDPRAVAGAGSGPALLPEGAGPPGAGGAGCYLRDVAVTVRALTTVARALDAAGQPGVADDARALADTLQADLDATIAAVAAGGAPVPATPSRPVDDGVVVNVDLFEPFGSLGPDHASFGATLDAVRARPSGGVPAVPSLHGPEGLSPRLTAQLAAVELVAGDARAGARLDWLVGAAGPTVVWPGAIHPRTGHGSAGPAQDVVATARFLAAVRRLLVRETTDGLALCSAVPPSWLGGSLDVRAAPTTFGLFSFSVRWHGERPALLWELEPHPHVEAVTITAPGLDPSWSASGFEGEALLAAPAPAAAENLGGIGAVPDQNARSERQAAPDPGGGSFT